MSDTPRTDLIEDGRSGSPLDLDEYDRALAHARTLERELAAATARIAELEAANAAFKREEVFWHALNDETAHRAREATTRAESAERDALQRAADACEVKGMEWQRQYINAKENDHLLNGLSGGALDCRDAILALIPKERT